MWSHRSVGRNCTTSFSVVLINFNLSFKAFCDVFHFSEIFQTLQIIYARCTSSLVMYAEQSGLKKSFS